MLPPNAPKAAGREAIQKGWDDMFKTPGVTLTFETERFVIAKSGDLAVDIGTYKFAADGGIERHRQVRRHLGEEGRQMAGADRHVLKRRPTAATRARRHSPRRLRRGPRPRRNRPGTNTSANRAHSDDTTGAVASRDPGSARRSLRRRRALPSLGPRASCPLLLHSAAVTIGCFISCAA